MDAATLDSLTATNPWTTIPADPDGGFISGEGVLVDVLGTHPAGVRTTREQLTALLNAELGRLDPVTGNVLNMDVMDDHEIASALEVVASQRLVRRLCPQCRQQVAPRKDAERWAAGLGWTLPDRVWRAVGCSACRNIGYQGRNGIFEIWYLDEEDRELILSHANEGALRRRLTDRPGGLLFADGMAQLESGTTSLGELRVALGDCARLYKEACPSQRTIRRENGLSAPVMCEI